MKEEYYITMWMALKRKIIAEIKKNKYRSIEMQEALLEMSRLEESVYLHGGLYEEEENEDVVQM